MAQIRGIYEKYHKPIENILFPLVLVLYPLLHINQGMDVSDTTYSLSNFQYFGQMNGTWMVATFLANATGNLLMHLPFGATFLGMNFYTALIQTVIAVTAYFVLRGRIPAPLVMLGEFLALGLCWCPSVILYNYLTYLLLTAAILLLYAGIMSPCERKRRWYFMAAGISLGANVAVRMPNVVQAALIAAVWYGVWIMGGNADPEKTVAGGDSRFFRYRLIRATLWCLDGYLIGFGIPFLAICVRYGVQAYPAMIQTMFAMTQKAEDYKPASMLTGMFADYGRGLFWLLFAGICMLGGWLLFGVLGRLAKRDSVNRADNEYCKDTNLSRGMLVLYGVCGSCYVAVWLILLRFYWGRGVFSFRYYEYGSMYYPAVFLLLFCILAAVWCLVSKKVQREKKVFAALVMSEIFLTPLGSNNALYPIINNLFLAVPFLLWVAYGWFVQKKCEKGICAFVWKAPLLVLLVFVLVQSMGFHMHFVFQDGVAGEKRDTLVKSPAKAAGMYTHQENGALLEELAVYASDAGLSGRKVILYGEIPGLGYLLDMPPALSTFWPDLDSYRMVEFDRDMAQAAYEAQAGQSGPVIILSSPTAAYLSEDAEAMNWFGVDLKKMKGDEKLQKLGTFMRAHGYVEKFSNARYVVYDTAPTLRNGS